MIITAHILEKSGACEDAVKFVERNFPNGFDGDRVRASGSKLAWYDWLMCWEYDERNNRTKVTGPDGDVTLYEYDERNNRTKRTGPWGVTLYEYDYAPDGSLREMRENGERIVWFE